MEKDLCACYSRVSSTEQSLSCEHQQQILEDWCKQHNYIPIQYSDNGISGTGFKQRKQFLKMLEDINIYWTPQYETFYINNTKDLKFNRIVCKSSSRFGRSLDCIKIIQLINRQNVELIFLEDGESGVDMLDPNSNLITSINATINQHFSIQNSQRVKHGMRQSSLNGQVLTNNTIFGYTYNKNTKQLEIIPQQAEIIRWIFDSYINGLGYKRIADTLNNQGHRTKQGKEFKAELISYIIQNEKYAGLNVRNKYKKSKIQGDTRAKKKDKSEWIITENIPAIISLDTFNKANELRLSKKSNNRGKYKGTTPLAGKIKCLKCGHYYNLNYYTNSTGDKIYYYVCWGKKFKSKKYCDNKNLYVHTIQQLIDDTFINSLVFRNKKLRLNSISTAIKDLNNKVNNYNKEQQEALKSRVIQAKNSKSKLLDLLINNNISQQDFDFKNNELDKELAQLQIQIEELEGGAEDKLKKLKDLHNKIGKIPINKHYTQEEIYNMIQQIKVLDNKLTVTININGITFTEELEY